MLDDMGQKWKHTTDQFETKRLFARARNPDDDSLTVGPGIFNLFKRQVNAYGELAAYKHDCNKLVPKPVVQVKTNWRTGNDVRSAKPKKQAPQQQMAPAVAHARPAMGRGGGRPPATAPVAAVAALP